MQIGPISSYFILHCSISLYLIVLRSTSSYFVLVHSTSFYFTTLLLPCIFEHTFQYSHLAHLVGACYILQLSPVSAHHRRTQVADDNNMKQYRVEKGRGREGGNGRTRCTVFFCSTSFQLLLATQPPHFPLLDPINPTKMTNASFSPPCPVSFYLNVMRRGKPLLIMFPFVLTTTGGSPLLVAVVLDTRRKGKPLLIVFPFVLNVTRRGEPLLVMFPFILTAMVLQWWVTCDITTNPQQ